MTASVLKQDPNTKRFKRTRIYFDTDRQYANLRGNPLCQATKRTIQTTDKLLKTMENEREKRILFRLIFVACLVPE